jgi:hypothetical protein
MGDIYKLNKQHLCLGVRDNLNDKKLVSKHKIETVCNSEQKLNAELNKSWIKLSKSQKLKKIKAFSQNYVENEPMLKAMCEDERQCIIKKCWDFLSDAMDKKRVNTKDIEYDSQNEKILKIKSLVYNEELGQFALKRGNNGSIMTAQKVC